MPSEPEIIKQLEEEIGKPLGGVSIDGSYVAAFGAHIGFDDFCEDHWWGLFFDDDKNVVGLAITNGGLKTVPPHILNLRHLRRIDLSANRITAFPDEVLQLPNLELIDLSDNLIAKLPSTVLDVGLPVECGSLVQGKGIFLEGNPLESPPIEIIGRGQAAMRDYFESLPAERPPLNEAKLLVVGGGGAGKTSLVKRMLWNDFDKHEPPTHRINIDPWAVTIGGTEVKLHVWDFGGQDIMHATHQFFLSERSLYILVLDGRKAEVSARSVDTRAGALTPNSSSCSRTHSKMSV